MTTVYDVPAQPLIEQVAKELREGDKVQPPEWAAFVKTGMHTERPPEDPLWWYIRSAAVLRKVAIKGPIGIERLRAEFGGPKDRGSKPYRAVRGSGAITRTIVHQLEQAQLLKVAGPGKGREVAPEGQRVLDNAAHSVKTGLVEQIPGLAKY